jgi:RimJ/RimL family protein N-acetyltransferase
MYLRSLMMKDEQGILEWMKDESLNLYFQFNHDEVNSESVRNFIEKSWSDTNNKHYAVADDNDEYMGTISLKNIDHRHSNAEYAVAFRRSAIGTGAASYATAMILMKAFEEFKLHKVYLNVLTDNARAVRFYEKSGFIFEGEFKEHLFIRDAYRDLRWYKMTRNDFEISSIRKFLD